MSFCPMVKRVNRRLAVTLLTFPWLVAGPASADQLDEQTIDELRALLRSPDRLVAQSRLQLEAPSSLAISGILESDYGGQRIIFRSVMTTPAEAVVQIEIPGSHAWLEAEADFAANLRTLDGHQHALTVVERIALTALVAQLEQLLQPYPLPPAPHEDFLFRVTSYWCEAPVGWPLGRHEIDLNDVIEADPIGEDVSAPHGGGGDEPEGGGCPNDVDQLGSCNDPGLCGEPSDNSTRVCPNPCGAAQFTLWHDACPGHDYCPETLPAGCQTCDCRGRCGPECGSNDGAGVYMIDCAEHDRCCHIHGACLNPNAVLCGDEFNDAADDFFATDNCPGGCAANTVCPSCPSFNETRATPTTSWQTDSESIGTGQCRMYRVNLVAGATYTFKTGCGDGATANFDTVIQAYKPSGDCPYSPSWTNDDGCESNRSRVTVVPTSTGNHYVKVRSFCSTGSSLPIGGNFTLAYRAEPVSISSANPPNAGKNPYGEGQVFLDALDTGSGPVLTEGIGAAGTASQGPIQYSPVRVTFSGPPTPPPTPANITVSCTGGVCPTILGVATINATTFDITLSGAIPPLHCTTLTFVGTHASEKLEYRSSPGNVSMDAAANTQDLLTLVQALNNGSANLSGNLARYNMDRSTNVNPVNTQDLLRLIQLLNGVSTTQPFNGAAVALCP